MSTCDDEFKVGLYNREKLNELKGLRRNVDWEIETERVKFLCQLDLLINDWKGQFPNLQDFFHPEEIECILKDSIKCIEEHVHYSAGERFIKFVVRTGYTDEPDVDEYSKTLLHRTTPLHLAAKYSRSSYIVPELFKIYDRCDLNYIDVNGFTHFHVACKNGCDDVVEKFLEFGQDPNCNEQKSVDTPLNLALNNGGRKVAELLLTNGADPNLADEEGHTPLHALCSRGVDDDLADKFFQICDAIDKSVQVDAVDNTGVTPLRSALVLGTKRIAEVLLRRGVDPNLSDKEGLAALHHIALPKIYDDWAGTFFKICDDIQQTVQVNTLDKSGQTPLHLALNNGHRKLTELLLRRGADPNLTDQEGSTALHHILLYENVNVYDLAEIFFKICDDIQQTVKLDVRDKRGHTPLLLALRNDKKNVSELLLRRGADPNVIDEEGLTALHFIASREMDDDLPEMFFKICDDIQQTVQVNTLDKLGQTPLHLALDNGHRKLTELLLRRGADPNLADKDDGFAALHNIALREIDDDLVEIFLKICDDVQQTVQIDVQDKWGRTPLNLALSKGKKNVSESLMRKGADLNSTSNEGSTPLHLICMFCEEASFLVKMLFELSDKRNHPLQVDAQDDLHQTPLHYSVDRGLKEVTELLLKRGADPNLATVSGFTPLHIICMRYWEEEFVEIFLKICDDIQQTVQIDVHDKMGRTPLQWAVANLMLNAVDSLVERGADLSSFIFPIIYPEWLRDVNCKLTLASGLMAVVKRLENRGYEPDRSDALAIMKLFHNYKLFEKTADLDEYWYDDEKFAIEAKKIMIYSRSERLYYDDEAEFVREKDETMMSPSLSIYDLVWLRPDEVAKLLVYEDYFELVHPKKIDKSTSCLSVACLVHLCEKLSRRFFRVWATISFYELIHNRLSIECCEMIIDNLTNQDLYHICLAAVGQNS